MINAHQRTKKGMLVRFSRVTDSAEWWTFSEPEIQDSLQTFSNVGKFFISSVNVKVMAHLLTGANVDRGVGVEIACDHRLQRG